MKPPRSVAGRLPLVLALLHLVSGGRADAISQQPQSLPAGTVLDVSALMPPESRCLPFPAPTAAQPLVAGVKSWFEGPESIQGYAKSPLIAPPADANIAAGVNHVIIATNPVITISTKNGRCIKQISPTRWFKNVSAPEGVSDPRIAYDAVRGHWLLVAQWHVAKQTSQGYIFLSVSQTNDPTGLWWNWKLDGRLTYGTADTVADAPDVGFDANLMAPAPGSFLYITSEQRDLNDLQQTVGLYMIPKDLAYAGSSFSCWQAWGAKDTNMVDGISIRPAKMLGTMSGSAVEYMVSTDVPPAGLMRSTVFLWTVVPKVPPTLPTWTAAAVTLPSSYANAADANQPAACAGNKIELVSFQTHVFDAVWQADKLYFGFNSKAGAGNAQARFVRLGTSGGIGTAEVVKAITVGGTDVFFPALGVDGTGGMFLSLTRSGSSDPLGASAYYTRMAAAAANPDTPYLIQPGSACLGPTAYSQTRWGDYLGAAQDPVDSRYVWIVGEFAKLANMNFPISDFNWATWVSQVTLAADVALTCSPSTLSVPNPGSASATCTLTSLNGFSGSVTMSATPSPAFPGTVTASYMPSPVSVPAGGTGTTTLTVTAAAGALPAYYSLTATGTGGATPANFLLTQVIVQGAPAITSIDPSSGSTMGGTVVTINGSGFQTTIPAPIDGDASPRPLTPATVTIGGAPAMVTMVTANTITATTGPNGAGIYDVVVSNPGANSFTLPEGFAYTDCPDAPAVGNNGPICAGQALNLTASTIPGATYSWAGPNGFSSTLQNPTIPAATAAATGTYGVAVTLNSCQSFASHTDVVVNPDTAPPAVTAPSAVTVTQTLCQ